MCANNVLEIPTMAEMWINGLDEAEAESTRLVAIIMPGMDVGQVGALLEGIAPV